MSKPLFEFLFQPGEAIEVRVVAPWCGSGFFDNAKDLGDALSELDELKPEAVYCSLNPVRLRRSIAALISSNALSVASSWRAMAPIFPAAPGS
jgi:hypothetical protein